MIYHKKGRHVTLNKKVIYSVFIVSPVSAVSQNNSYAKEHILEWLFSSSLLTFYNSQDITHNKEWSSPKCQFAEIEKPQSRNIEISLLLIFGRLTQTSFVT